MIIPCEKPDEDKIQKIGELKLFNFEEWARTENRLLTNIGDAITVNQNGVYETVYIPQMDNYKRRYYYFYGKDVFMEIEGQ